MRKYRNLLVAAVLLAAGAAYAALIDNYDVPRVSSVVVTCPESGVCSVEIMRVRTMLPAAQTEASGLGISTDPIVEKVVLRRTSRANLNTFIGGTAP